MRLVWLAAALAAVGCSAGGADAWSLLTPATARTVGDRAPGGDPVAHEDRIRAALELLTPIAERAGADADRFLAEIALGAEVDVWDPRADRVSLLTLHAAKGLEFPVVFVVGCEDELLPMTFGGTPPDVAAVAEERRLLFVGMTRARTHLVLSAAARRTVRGQVRDTRPSRFLADLPDALLDRTDRPARRRTVQLRLL